ncbi:MAG: flagellar biosynthesis/type III secretory pathway protein, partial [Bilophila sp.]
MVHDSDDNRWGTIFMGPTSDRESSIDRVTEGRQRDLWNRRTEAEYMERVRDKATVRVQAMLDQARANAEAMRTVARNWAEKVKQDCDAMLAQAEQTKAEAEAIRAEAEHIRDAAQEEGYKIGVEQAFMELDEHRLALDDTTASVLKTIEGQSETLFEGWR